MFDSSTYPFEENIERTAKVVELAKKYGATVEAELGLVGGSEDGSEDHGIRCTNPDDAKYLSSVPESMHWQLQLEMHMAIIR